MSDEVTTLDVNQASFDELQNVPGIDTGLAVEIIAARPFFSTEDLFTRLGVDAARVEALREYLTVVPLPELAASAVATPEGAAQAEAREEPLHRETPLTQPDGYVKTSAAIGWGAAAALVVLFLSLALNLLTLRSINSTLQYASAAQAGSLSSQLGLLQDQTTAVQDEVDALRSRVDALDALSGKITALETADTELQAALDETSAQLETLQTEQQKMQTQLKTLSTQANRFEQFLDGLRDLLVETPAP